MQITSIMGLLSSKQRILVNRLSQLVINDSQGSSSSSEGRKADGDELNIIELNHLETLGKQMFKSKKATD